MIADGIGMIIKAFNFLNISIVTGFTNTFGFMFYVIPAIFLCFLWRFLLGPFMAKHSDDAAGILDDFYDYEQDHKIGFKEHGYRPRRRAGFTSRF